MSNELKELTKTLIETQVIKAMKDAPEYIETLIGAALNEPVNVGSQYSPKNIPWLQNKFNEVIQSATHKVIVDRITELMPTIREKVALKLTDDTIVDAFTTSINMAAKEDWRIQVSFQKDKP
jgi:hypothetical protein